MLTDRQRHLSSVTRDYRLHIKYYNNMTMIPLKFSNILWFNEQDNTHVYIWMCVCMRACVCVCNFIQRIWRIESGQAELQRHGQGGQARGVQQTSVFPAELSHQGVPSPGTQQGLIGLHLYVNVTEVVITDLLFYASILSLVFRPHYS